MAAKKEVKGVVKLVVPAKQANPAPPIGPALGAAGAVGRYLGKTIVREELAATIVISRVLL